MWSYPQQRAGQAATAHHRLIPLQVYDYLMNVRLPRCYLVRIHSEKKIEPAVKVSTEKKNE